MQKEFKYTEGEASYFGMAEQADRFWGKGVKITTYESQGQVRDRIMFSCHPEFEGFDELQQLTSDELIELSIDFLNNGFLDDPLQKIRRHGLTLYCRLNDEKGIVAVRRFTKRP